MFGHSDNQQVNDPSMQGQQSSDPAMANDQVMHDGSLEEPASSPVNGGYGLDAIPAAPEPVPTPQNPFTVPTVGAPAPEPAAPSFSPSPAPSAPATTDSGSDLLDIKQKALQELSPLVDHLEQSPEEKFKTTMMMIQASDDQSLLPTAYDAAQAITDEKAKAQALLDVVNEINYFTQSH